MRSGQQPQGDTSVGTSVGTSVDTTVHTSVSTSVAAVDTAVDASMSSVHLAARLRAIGMKVTPQRELILRIVAANTSHPTAESVFSTARAQMPMISLKTVYQTLNDLAQAGEIRTIDIGSGAARFDPNTGDHHHAVCDTCATIVDVDLAAVADLDTRHGFTVSDIDVTFRGSCASCTAASDC